MQPTCTAETSNVDSPLPVVIPPDGQPHPGYCPSHTVSSAAKRAASDALSPSAVDEPQQLVTWLPTRQSASVVQLPSKVGKVPGHMTTSPSNVVAPSVLPP